ncbi:MAG: adenosine deaminase [Cyanophyceae cyanobacterium]
MAFSLTRSALKLSASVMFAGLGIGGSLAIAEGAKARDISSQSSPASAEEVQIDRWLEQNRDRPTLLRAFVQRFPKGGDIHSHLSGAVYAENYLRWAAEDGYCVDPDAGDGRPALILPEDCHQHSRYFSASELLGRSSIYDALVNSFSTRNLEFSGRSGHDQFFSTFGTFSPISSSESRQDDMVAEVANRAASQHIFYLELMRTVKGSPVRRLGREVKSEFEQRAGREINWQQDFEALRQLLIDRGLMDLVATGSEEVNALQREVEKTLGCDTPNPQPGCEVTVRFLQQTTRTKTPEQVFAQFVYAFELVKTNSQVVGLNLVAPEDHPIALRDYTLQMEMLGFLKSKFPEVKVALHAGELTIGLVPPEQLRSNIREAVEIAQASRIGHGVDVLYENKPFELMDMMRERGVLVEICLTSNEVILNVSGDDHPFQDYLDAAVPVTLASDDEGVARIDLSHEYLLATTRYNLDYRKLKYLARNSLEHSFLPGDGLWASGTFQEFRGPCQGDRPGSGSISQPCSAFLTSSDRARSQWRLEAEFAAFEALPSFKSN